jgi:phosphoglycolate phosphatase
MEMMKLQKSDSVFSTPPKVIAFDCDGVLFDSRDANIHFYTHILEQVGHPPVRPDQVEYIHMHPVRESLMYLLGTGSSFDEAFEYFRKIDFSPFNSYLRCEPGIEDALRYAKSHYLTALATNRTVSTLQLLARHDLSKYFDLVVSSSDVEHPKPHPDEMDRIRAVFRVRAEEIVYIGDSTVDEEFAANSGVFFIAYKNRQLKAQCHIDHLSELRALLESPRSDCDNGT